MKRISDSRGKAIWALLCLLASVLAAGAASPLPTLLAVAACAVQPVGLVAWWPGENNADDLFGIHPGILTNGTTFSAGKVGQAFQFDGIDDYAYVPATRSLAVSNAVTLEAWIRHTQLGASVQRYVTVSPEKAQIRYDGLVSPVGYHFSIKVGGTFYQLRPGLVPTVNVFHHVVGSYDGSVQRLYVDGALVASQPVRGWLDPLTTSRVLLSNGPGESMHGLIDEPSVYNRALTAGEVLALYEAGGAGKCSPPVIITSPLSQTTLLGGTVDFTVTAYGSGPLLYQWHRNAAPLLSATNLTLTVSNSTLSDAGSYTVTLTNPYGSATSAVATLTVLVPPTLLAQPIGQTAECGRDVTFSVDATSTDPLEYRWYFNGTNLLSAGAAASFTLNQAHFGQAGDYSVTVTNGLGSVTSASAALVVSDTTPPIITTCPPERSLLADDSCSGVIPDLRGEIVTMDVCGPVTVMQVPAAGTVLDLGSTNVTMTVADQAGNRASCEVTVTLFDWTPPELTCPSNLVVTIAATEDRATAEYAAPLMRDNCRGATVVCTPASGSTFAVGTNTVVCVGTDGAGQTNRCSFTVLVNRAPLAGADRMVTVAGGFASVALEELLANDNDPDGDALTITKVGPASLNGGTVQRAGNDLVYFPAANFIGQDRFDYTVSDGWGGMALGSVLVEVLACDDATYNRITDLVVESDRVAMSLQGISGRVYTLERAPDLIEWSAIGSVRTGVDGIVHLEDRVPPAGMAFYRIFAP